MGTHGSPAHSWLWAWCRMPIQRQGYPVCLLYSAWPLLTLKGVLCYFLLCILWQLPNLSVPLWGL